MESKIQNKIARNSRYYQKHRDELKRKRNDKLRHLKEAASRGDSLAVKDLEQCRIKNRERQKRFRGKHADERAKRVAATIPRNVGFNLFLFT